MKNITVWRAEAAQYIGIFGSWTGGVHCRHSTRLQGRPVPRHAQQLFRKLEIGGVGGLVFVAVPREVLRAHHAELARNPVRAFRATYKIYPSLPFLATRGKIVKKHTIDAFAGAAFDNTLRSRNQRHIMRLRTLTKETEPRRLCCTAVCACFEA